MAKALKKILLVEDEVKMAEMYKQVFEKNGFKMELAFDGEKGWEMLKKSKPDLILLDVLLPGENGIGFLRRLRENSEFKDLPVIVLSNYDVPETKEEAKQLKALAYLMKADFIPQTLVKEVKSYLTD